MLVVINIQNNIYLSAGTQVWQTLCCLHTDPTPEALLGFILGCSVITPPTARWQFRFFCSAVARIAEFPLICFLCGSFSHCIYLGWPKGVLVVSVVRLGQCKHNDRTLLRTKAAVLRYDRRGTLVRFGCGVRASYRGQTQLQGAQHSLSERGFRSSLDVVRLWRRT